MTVHEPASLQLFCSFTIEQNLYGFDIRIIKEITPVVRITSVPLKQAEVCGVVNIRGQVIMVVDIGVILGAKNRIQPQESQIIILKTAREIDAIVDYTPAFDVTILGNKPIGFIVESVGDIVTAESTAIEQTPSHIPMEQTPFIDGIVHLHDQPFVILNAGKIFGCA